MKKDEKVLVASSVSKKNLLLVWLGLPILLLVIYLPTVISAIISISKNADRAVGVMAFLGIDLAGLLQASGLSKAISIFITVIISFIVLIWVMIGLFFTFRYLGYRLVLTDKRIVGKAKNESMDVPWDKVLNVTISHTWLERLFKYGTVNIVTKHYSMTFKCMSKPDEIKRVIFAHICD